MGTGSEYGQWAVSGIVNMPSASSLIPPLVCPFSGFWAQLTFVLEGLSDEVSEMVPRMGQGSAGAGLGCS